MSPIWKDNPRVEGCWRGFARAGKTFPEHPSPTPPAHRDNIHPQGHHPPPLIFQSTPSGSFQKKGSSSKHSPKKNINMYTDRNFVTNYLQVVMYLVLVGSRMKNLKKWFGSELLCIDKILLVLSKLLVKFLK